MIDSYKKLGESVGALVQEKQEAYGNSFGRAGDVMRLLYPEGTPLEAMDDALTIVRMLDKMFRIAQSHKSDPMGESPFKDITGYGLLATARAEYPELMHALGEAARKKALECNVESNTPKED